MSAKDNKIMNSFRKLEKIADLKALLEEQKQDQINKKDMNLDFKVKKKEESKKYPEELVFVRTKGKQYWPAKCLYKWKKENGKELFQVVLFATYESLNVSKNRILEFNDKNIKRFSYQNSTNAYRIAMTEILENSGSIQKCSRKENKNIDFGVFEVESILNCRVTQDDQIEYLIKWKNFDISSSTWENENDLACPEILKNFEENLIYSLG